MSEIDQQFVEYVIKSLVNKPDAVHIDRSIDEKGVLLELTVDPEDLGRVIGKRGATAQSIRTLLRALGTKNDARYNLKIVDNGVKPASYASDNSQSSTDSGKQSTTDDQTDSQQDLANETPTIALDNVEEDATSDRLSKTRQELADLDDLDV
jgi:hypothetical protein